MRRALFTRPKFADLAVWRSPAICLLSAVLFLVLSLGELIDHGKMGTHLFTLVGISLLFLLCGVCGIVGRRRKVVEEASDLKPKR